MYKTVSKFPPALLYLHRGDVVEIQGPAASGKTEALYLLAMNCILPNEVILIGMSQPRSLRIGGWDKAAVIIDSDSAWQSSHFCHLLSSALSKIWPVASDSQPLHPSINELIRTSLKNLHVFQPKSSLAIAATLLHLPIYRAENDIPTEVALLVIDSISTFYWSDRARLEKLQITDSEFSPLNRVLKSLQALRRSHGPVIALTSWGLSGVAKAREEARKAVEDRERQRISSSSLASNIQADNFMVVVKPRMSVTTTHPPLTSPGLVLHYAP